MSTLSFPHDWPHPDTLRQEPCASGPSRLRALRYLEERYSLREEDLRDHDELLMAIARQFDQTDHLIVSSVTLFRTSIRNALSNLGRNAVSEEDVKEYTEMVRNRVFQASFEGVETFLESVHPLKAVDSFREAIPCSLRPNALAEMDELFGEVFEAWGEAEYGLSDEEMRARFFVRAAADHRFLSTYFDSAYKGLIDIRLQKHVDRLAAANLDSMEWKGYIRAMKARITRSLEVVGPGEERRFSPRQCSFHANGTGAFKAFREACIPRGSRVLVSSEEYSEILDDMRANGIEVVSFSSLDELVHLLDDSSFDFMLVSEVGRKGGVYPLSVYNEARKLLSPKTKFIVDACQSAGRRKHDFRSCEADAVILSTLKGADLGEGVGVLALAADFEHERLADMSGTISDVGVARTAFAMNPSGLDASLDVLTPEQKAEAIDDRVRKFLELLSVINAEIGHRIKILSRVDTEAKPMGHAMEIMIEGVSRKKLSKLARSYGVYIAHAYDSPANDESIRVGFLAHTNYEALKLLAYVLRVACLDQK